MLDRHTKMGNKPVDSIKIDKGEFVVYGCWDKGTPHGEYEFYDVYQRQGDNLICINEGEPFWEKPTAEDIKEFMF